MGFTNDDRPIENFGFGSVDSQSQGEGRTILLISIFDASSSKTGQDAFATAFKINLSHYSRGTKLVAGSLYPYYAGIPDDYFGMASANTWNDVFLLHDGKVFAIQESISPVLSNPTTDQQKAEYNNLEQAFDGILQSFQFN